MRLTCVKIVPSLPMVASQDTGSVFGAIGIVVFGGYERCANWRADVQIPISI